MFVTFNLVSLLVGLTAIAPILCRKFGNYETVARIYDSSTQRYTYIEQRKGAAPGSLPDSLLLVKKHH